MKVWIYDWDVGASKGFAHKAIRLATNLNLADAKAVVDRCLESQPVVVECHDNESALDLIRQLDDAGFLAKRLPT